MVLMNTKDILYVVENEFKKDLSNAMSTVMINKGKSLVKLTTKFLKRRKNQKVLQNLVNQRHKLEIL